MPCYLILDELSRRRFLQHIICGRRLLGGLRFGGLQVPLYHCPLRGATIGVNLRRLSIRGRGDPFHRIIIREELRLHVGCEPYDQEHQDHE